MGCTRSMRVQIVRLIDNYWFGWLCCANDEARASCASSFTRPRRSQAHTDARRHARAHRHEANARPLDQPAFVVVVPISIEAMSEASELAVCKCLRAFRKIRMERLEATTTTPQSSCELFVAGTLR